MKEINTKVTKGKYPIGVSVLADFKILIPNGFYFLEDEFLELMKLCIERGILDFTHLDDTIDLKKEDL